MVIVKKLHTGVKKLYVHRKKVALLRKKVAYIVKKLYFFVKKVYLEQISILIRKKVALFSGQRRKKSVY